MKVSNREYFKYFMIKQGRIIIQKDTQNHDNIAFQNELSLRRSMNISHIPIWSFMDERGTSNVIPHLSRYHCQAEKLQNKY